MGCLGFRACQAGARLVCRARGGSACAWKVVHQILRLHPPKAAGPPCPALTRPPGCHDAHLLAVGRQVGAGRVRRCVLLTPRGSEHHGHFLTTTPTPASFDPAVIKAAQSSQHVPLALASSDGPLAGTGQTQNFTKQSACCPPPTLPTTQHPSTPALPTPVPPHPNTPTCSHGERAVAAPRAAGCVLPLAPYKVQGQHRKHAEWVATLSRDCEGRVGAGRVGGFALPSCKVEMRGCAQGGGFC
jgi:hypothetical protein